MAHRKDEVDCYASFLLRELNFDGLEDIGLFLFGIINGLSDLTFALGSRAVFNFRWSKSILWLSSSVPAQVILSKVLNSLSNYLKVEQSTIAENALTGSFFFFFSLCRLTADATLYLIFSLATSITSLYKQIIWALGDNGDFAFFVFRLRFCLGLLSVWVISMLLISCLFVNFEDINIFSRL